MDNEDVIYTHNDITLRNKKEQNFDVCNNMDGLIIKLSDLSQREKDKYYMILLYMKDKYFMILLICGNLKKYKKIVTISVNRLTDRRQTCGYQCGG